MTSTVVDPNPEIIEEMPAFPHRVLQVGIPFYTDPQCTQPVSEASIVILQALEPDDPIQELDIVPTRKEYTVGQIVQWDLNNKKIWEKCWYRNPETGRVEQAWTTFHVEFIGKVVSEAAMEKNRQELDQKIARMPAPKPSTVN
jgi:hypothetical protein